MKGLLGIILLILVGAFFLNFNPAIFNSQFDVEDLVGQKDPCDHPDSDISCCFVHMPEIISHIMIITETAEAVEPLRISGRVFDERTNHSLGGVIIYAYHTDEAGYYSKSGSEKGVQKWHGKHHGWCKTDDGGQYELKTIRPGPYPTNTLPAHIHLAIKMPKEEEPFYINDIVFEDDELVNEEYRSNLPYPRGGSGIVELKKVNNTWVGVRNINL